MEECLSRELIYELSESWVVFSDCRDYYNKQRLRRSVGLLTRSEFATKQLGGPSRLRVSNLLRDTCYLNQITSGYFLWKWSYTTTPRPSVELNNSSEGRP
ncbi:hypothetical protein GA004_09030 [Candidatus Pelagisphaera phototrophica]|nr:hypothetical protein GA004_09030 [Candidatus Pelagisphaera phototrophica]